MGDPFRGQLGLSSAKERTLRLERAPITQARLLGTEHPSLRAVLHLIPQVLDLRLQGRELSRTRVMREGTTVAQVNELEALGSLTARALQHIGIKAHLEEGIFLEARGWRLPGFVIDDAHRAIGCHVEAIHKAAQEQTGGSTSLEEHLPLGRV